MNDIFYDLNRSRLPAFFVTFVFFTLQRKKKSLETTIKFRSPRADHQRKPLLLKLIQSTEISSFFLRYTDDQIEWWSEREIKRPQVDEEANKCKEAEEKRRRRRGVVVEEKSSFHKFPDVQSPWPWTGNLSFIYKI